MRIGKIIASTFAVGALALIPAVVSLKAETINVPDNVTFAKDIAPILFEHCGSCHRRGDPAAAARTSKDGVPGATVDDPRDQWCIAGAPFSLVEYRDVQIHASQVASATRRRSMPPWQLLQRG